MRKLLLYIIFSSSIISQSRYGPTPLKYKILGCDRIVIGYVKKFDIAKKYLDSTSTKSIIVVKEILKGKYIHQIPIPNNILTEREQNMHLSHDSPTIIYYGCSTEKSFNNNESILAFVYKSYLGDCIITDNQWDHNSKNLNPTEIQLYRKKVLKYLDILQNTNPIVKDSMEVEWILSLCENPLTIWDGLSLIKDSKITFTYEQKTRLRKIIMGLRKIDYCKLEIIDFLFSINDDQVLANMLDLLERKELRDLHADLIMGYITSFDNSKKLLKLFYKYMDRCEIMEDKNRNICNKLINEFIIAAKKSLTSNSKRPRR